MTDDAVNSRPVVPPELYDQLRTVVAAEGPAGAIERLIAELRKAEDFHNLFYALLLKKRVELGVSPFPTGPASELPPETHEPYEQAIREAGREVGHALLARKRFTQAWTFFRMLGEPEPVRAALADYQPGPDDDIYPLIEIAWQGGVLPKKGFDLVLDRHGVCSAITMVSSSDLRNNDDLRDYCIGRLVHALHAQLTDRLRADLAGRGQAVPADATIPQIVETHPELFAEDGYHIDTSHLSSVVQMSTYLPPGPENDLARELCIYGRRLSRGLQGHTEVPFEDGYDDYLAFLEVVAGRNVAEGLARFRMKAEREAAEGSTYAAQVYVNLLVRAGRPAEALAAAKQFLLSEDDHNLICPGVNELAKRLGDHASLAEAAQARNDPVTFLASLIADQNQRPT
jgi:hypothetical protein